MQWRCQNWVSKTSLFTWSIACCHCTRTILHKTGLQFGHGIDITAMPRKFINFDLDWTWYGNISFIWIHIQSEINASLKIIHLKKYLKTKMYLRNYILDNFRKYTFNSAFLGNFLVPSITNFVRFMLKLLISL